MPARISRSLLDPVLTPVAPHLYKLLNLSRKLWPEAIVVTGHLIAAAGAGALAFSTQYWWRGILAALAIAGNHTADMVDGTHARQDNVAMGVSYSITSLTRSVSRTGSSASRCPWDASRSVSR